MTSTFAHKKQYALRRLESSIPEEWKIQQGLLPSQDVLNVMKVIDGHLESEEISITSLSSAIKIITAIKNGKYTATQIITAFLRRCAINSQLVNCATELMVEDAMERARLLDQHFAKHGTLLGPLHGVPISLKSQISIKGYPNAASWAVYADRIVDDDALLFKILTAAGAVPIVRTTTPQSMMQLECHSPIYGQTLNPYNRTLSSGGSSGGEGAVIALKGSVMGVGTDIGGSIRSPAANCGIYGLRPTTYRVPKMGLLSTQGTSEAIVGVAGPMCQSREDLGLFMQTVLDAKPWLVEPVLVPLPWRQDLHASLTITDLVVGVIWDDGVVLPHPYISRALHHVVHKLREGGAHVIEWQAVDMERHWEIITQLYYINGAKEERQLMHEGGEPVLPLTDWIMSQPGVSAKDWVGLKEVVGARDDFRNRYASLWNERAKQQSALGKIDCLLSPVAPSAAPPLGTAKYWSYTSIWNLVDYPSVVFPVTTVDQTMDRGQVRADEPWRRQWDSHVPRNESDLANRQAFERYDYKDAPVSLQITSRRFEDEKVLRCLELVEQAMGR